MPCSGLLTERVPLILPDGVGDVDGQVARQRAGGVVVLHSSAALNDSCKETAV